MIAKLPTDAVIEQWKHTFEKYNGKLKPNRISGIDLLNYLQTHYISTEIYDDEALKVVCDNVNMNEHYKEKLPIHTSPIPMRKQEYIATRPFRLPFMQMIF